MPVPDQPAKATAGTLLPAPQRIYTLGPEGTFSDKAARRVVAELRTQGAAQEPAVVYTRTIPEVLARAAGDPDALGVCPIENSDTGTVLMAQDSLVKHAVTIRLEVNLRVRFSLLVRGPLDAVRTVLSQPVAYDQCALYLTEHLPEARPSFTNSNTESGLRFLEASGDEPLAAVVPYEFGTQHAAYMAAEDIQSDKLNTTRFLAVAPAAGPVVHDFTRYKTSLFIDPHEDRPGLLYDMLSVFKRFDLNLCRLESRPARVRPWTYVFFLDCNNNERTADALDALHQGDWQVRVLGSYDRVDG